MTRVSLSDLDVSEETLRKNPDLRKAMATVPASKYHNVRTEAKGMTFASGHEASVVSGLILAEKQRAIFGLRLQVRFPLPGGVVYVCDAMYAELVGGVLTVRVVDAKGLRTKEYLVKKKLFENTYKVPILEM